jgi:hypothetical protein
VYLRRAGAPNKPRRSAASAIDAVDYGGWVSDTKGAWRRLRLQRQRQRTGGYIYSPRQLVTVPMVETGAVARSIDSDGYGSWIAAVKGEWRQLRVKRKRQRASKAHGPGPSGAVKRPQRFPM